MRLVLLAVLVPQHLWRQEARRTASGGMGCMYERCCHQWHNSPFGNCAGLQAWAARACCRRPCLHDAHRGAACTACVEDTRGSPTWMSSWWLMLYLVHRATRCSSRVTTGS